MDWPGHGYCRRGAARRPPDSAADDPRAARSSRCGPGLASGSDRDGGFGTFAHCVLAGERAKTSYELGTAPRWAGRRTLPGPTSLAPARRRG
jgi:hypothetical protein